MPQFKFKFESVLKYRLYRLEQCRNLLAQILADDHSLVMNHRQLTQGKRLQIEDLRNLGRPGGIDVDAIAARRYYVGQLMGQMQMVEHQRRVIAEQIQMCRKALTKAEQEVKVLEKLKENHYAEHRYAQERRATHELEESWMASHAKEFTK